MSVFHLDDLEVKSYGTDDNPWVDVNLFTTEEVGCVGFISLTPEEAIMFANDLIATAGACITNYERLQNRHPDDEGWDDTARSGR